MQKMKGEKKEKLQNTWNETRKKGRKECKDNKNIEKTMEATKEETKEGKEGKHLLGRKCKGKKMKNAGKYLK